MDLSLAKLMEQKWTPLKYIGILELVYKHNLIENDYFDSSKKYAQQRHISMLLPNLDYPKEPKAATKKVHKNIKIQLRQLNINKKIMKEFNNRKFQLINEL